MFENVFDFTKPFGIFEAWSTIIVVCGIAFVCFLVLRHFRPKTEIKDKK